MKLNPHNWRFIIFAAIFMAAGVAQAETILLKSGQTVEGIIVEHADDSVKVDTGVGIPVTYYLDEIESITEAPPVEPEAPEIIPETVVEAEIPQPATKIFAPEPTDPPAPTLMTETPVPAPVILAQTQQVAPAPTPISSAITHKIEEKFPLYADVTSLPPWQAPRLSTDEYLEIQAKRARSIEQEHINSVVFVLMESMSGYWQELKGTHPLIRKIAESPAGLAIAAVIWLALYAAVCYPLMLLALRFKCDGGMAWIPILQIFELLRIAGKSPIWFLFLFFPLVNILAFLFIWMSIARRLQQPHWLGYFMLVPGVNLLVLWYLALVPAPAPKKRPEDIDTGIKFE